VLKTEPYLHAVKNEQRKINKPRTRRPSPSAGSLPEQGDEESQERKPANPGFPKWPLNCSWWCSVSWRDGTSRSPDYYRLALTKLQYITSRHGQIVAIRRRLRTENTSHTEAVNDGRRLPRQHTVLYRMRRRISTVLSSPHTAE